MKVNEFINKVENKEIEMSDVLTGAYIPFEEKVNWCKLIVKKCSHADAFTPEKYVVDNTVAYMLKKILIIKLYTCVEIDMEKDNLLEIFNDLDRSALVDFVIDCVRNSDKNELKRFEEIYKIVEQDYIENNRTVTAYMDKLLDVISNYGDGFREMIESGGING